jgi:hypothetical protein
MTTGKPRYRQNDQANMDFRGMGCKDINWLRIGFNDKLL